VYGSIYVVVLECIPFNPNEGRTEIIAQGITFDNKGEKGGIVA